MLKLILIPATISYPGTLTAFYFVALSGLRWIMQQKNGLRFVELPRNTFLLKASAKTEYDSRLLKTFR